MGTRWHLILPAVLVATAALPRPAWAGMPAPFTLTEVARLRIETVSFFLVVLLAAAALVAWVWNGLRAGVPRLPRLNYWRALGLVVLWGLLFSVVLAMVCGAGELMPPGAWGKQGATYRRKGTRN